MLSAAAKLQAQNSIRLSILKKEDHSPLAGASAHIITLNRTTIADSTGTVVFENLPMGTYSIIISSVGMEEREIRIDYPQPASTQAIFYLGETSEEEEEVVVTSTRISRSISDIPTRVETITGEELAEKGNMKPGDIRMLLNESTGIQTQQTSATSYNSSIRIQGLDGRYTQVLRDGFPLYSGFSGGLSLMQVAPLDLKQIEVIKGSSSTLYGGGAIAGIVNLVSKTPTAKRELSFVANATSAGGLDLSSFYSQRFKTIGVTIFGSRNTGKAYDPAKIGFTAIPQFRRYTVNPTLFIYGNKTNASLGLSYITEDRTGGSMGYIKNGGSGYYEKNSTDRITSQASVTHTLSDHSHLTFKNSYSRFNRAIQIPSYLFKGLQQSTFSEATFISKAGNRDWVVGANLLTDQFTERNQQMEALRDYKYTTLGGFIQNTWSVNRILTLETGLRADYVKQFGIELLPRISALMKFTPKLTVRVGGGLGYKTPSVFNEEAERIQFRHILPIDQKLTENEKSVGTNIDLNYRTKIGRVGFTINQLFFYTRLNEPLILTSAANGNWEFKNASGHIDTEGLETNLRLTYQDFKLFLGYTYANANSHFDHVKSWLPLTARHRLNNVLMYEKEGSIKIGAEAYFFSPQKLGDGAVGQSYWTFGLMGEKSWKHISLFINFENFTDTRQTRFDKIYTGSADNPIFKDIYAPVDGFVVNGGIKLRL
jgi:iron complex outermembrane receptor protein